MPEGDTIWRSARRLHAALAGAEVTLWDLRWGVLATSDLRGAVTTEVVSRGKHLLHRLDAGWTLHSHLRMEGQWRVEHPGADTARALRSADVRAAVGTATWSAIGVRLGMLDLVRTTDEHTLVGHLGPDVLGPDWDPQEVAHRLARDPRPLVEALLDQRVLAGVGTFWASEVLFVQGLHPWVVSSTLSAEAVDALLARLHRLMDGAKEHAIQSSTGVRRAGQEAYVHGRSGRPCRRCGSTVRVAMAGTAPRQRTIFSCPSCQGGMAPGDDGRPQRPLGSSRGSAPGHRRPRT
jgi:endonuclease-8